MKIFYTLFLLAMSLWLSAQVSFPESDATWINTVHNIFEQNSTNQYVLAQAENLCLTKEDTTIYGKRYKKLKVCGESYRGAIRPAGQKVYFVPPNSNFEQLLYDFSLTAGQVISNVYLEDHHGNGLPSTVNLEVELVDDVMIGGKLRKRIHFKGANGGHWVEGVGCVQGLLKSPYATNTKSWHQLVCMSTKDSTRYPLSSPNPCNLLTLNPINHYVDIFAEVTDQGGNPLSNYAVYVGGGYGASATPLKKFITDAQGRVHDSLIPGTTPSLYAYVYDCNENQVLDFEIASFGPESDSTTFKFVLNCPADTCDMVLKHTLVDNDSSLYRFEFESVGFAPQIITPLWTFSDGDWQNGVSGFERPVEPGYFTYCIDLGCQPDNKTCKTFYADPNCEARFFLDTVNSIVFNGNIIFWRNPKLGNKYSYEWDFGDGSISTNAYPVHSYSNPGTYEICLTITFNDGVTNCVHTFCDTVIFEQAHLTFQVMDPARISVDEFEDGRAEYSLYPNPASDEVILSWDENDNFLDKIGLYQINGQLIREWKGEEDGEQIIRLENIPPGVYIVKAAMQDAAKTVRLVVQ